MRMVRCNFRSLCSGARKLDFGKGLIEEKRWGKSLLSPIVLGSFLPVNSPCTVKLATMIQNAFFHVSTVKGYFYNRDNKNT